LISTNKAMDEYMEIDEVQISPEEIPDGILLASMVILRESESPERYTCPIWTRGLERSFKVSSWNLKYALNKKWHFLLRPKNALYLRCTVQGTYHVQAIVAMLEKNIEVSS
jgi:hypothetical protein